MFSSHFHCFSTHVSTFLPFVECILSVLLFALSTGLVHGMNSIVKAISIKMNSSSYGDQPLQIVELDAEINKIHQRMSVLSPTADFAQYFKLERAANKLVEKRKKIVSSRKISPIYSQTFVICLRAVAFCTSFALALHSSADTRLFIICSDYFYPFNFLLDFPFSITNFYWTDQVSSDFQPVSLFSFSILSLFTLNCWKNARIEMSKKAE